MFENIKEDKMTKAFGNLVTINYKIMDFDGDMNVSEEEFTKVWKCAMTNEQLSDEDIGKTF